MELQWPLIIFTTLVAWSAGLFGTQALMAALGTAEQIQAGTWARSWPSAGSRCSSTSSTGSASSTASGT